MTEVGRFRKKAVEVEAIQIVTPDARDQAIAWVRDGGYFASQPAGDFVYSHAMKLSTLEGDMHANWGDWIIRGTRGEFYPCKPGPFADTFEACDAEAFP